MRPFTRFQKVLARWIVLILVVGTLMLALRPNVISDQAYSLWSQLQYGLFDSPIHSIASSFQNLATLWNVYEDNVYLNEQLANQRTYQSLYLQEHAKNEQLQALADVKNAQMSDYICAAQIIYRSPQSWNQKLTISAGSDQGVKERMLAISSKGAIGLVTEVQASTANVELLTSNSLKNDVAVQVTLEDGSSAQGVLQGFDASVGFYTMVLYNYDTKLTNGMAVLTSGKGGNYPEGILVGTVDHIEEEDGTIVDTIYVKPVDNIYSADYVGILANVKDTGAKTDKSTDSNTGTDRNKDQDTDNNASGSDKDQNSETSSSSSSSSASAYSSQYQTGQYINGLDSYDDVQGQSDETGNDIDIEDETDKDINMDAEAEAEEGEQP